tara:strand:- start:550 stop:1227 length:678 start_codon:yes stop_codon:yes gene_type:complete
MKISIRNWDRFQHYQNRRPPWIKIHRELLDDRQWSECSPDASKLLVELWLIASEDERGVIDKNLGDLAFRLRRGEAEMKTILQELVVQRFITLEGVDDSKVLAISLQPATPETEREREKETEGEKRKRPAYSDSFELVWSLHRRGPKSKAFESYKKAVKNGTTHELVLAGLEAYVANELDDKFKGAHLFRWIDGAMWEQDTGPRKKKTRSSIVLKNWQPPSLMGE